VRGGIRAEAMRFGDFWETEVEVEIR
jgi:hypothetical protein